MMVDVREFVFLYYINILSFKISCDENNFTHIRTSELFTVYNGILFDYYSDEP